MLVIFVTRHVTKMAVTLFDPPYQKTPHYMQTSMFYKTGVIAAGSFTLQE